MTEQPESGRLASSRYEELLDVAAELFSEHGYDGTKVRMISERMGIKSGSLYSHIAGKEDLLREIALRVGRLFLDQAGQALDGIDAPDLALAAICRAHLQVIHDHQTAVTVYYNEWRRLSPQSRRQVVELRDRYESLVREIIEEGSRSGVFDVPSARVGALVALSVLNWTYQWYRADGPASPEQIAGEDVGLLLRGLLRRT
jgi:TetR/AcrR family transcriptional regulator, cholesterol catabolism regulator